MVATSAHPWLDLARREVGKREIPGPKNNEEILSTYRDCGHSGITSETVPWCAAQMGSWLVRCGLPIPDKNNLLARSYLTYGVRCELKVGAIVVLPRGKSRRGPYGHVTICHAILPGGDEFVGLGGNQSDAVGFATYRVADILPNGIRWPVEAKVEALREAGSTEIRNADLAETGAAVAVGGAAIIKTVTSSPDPVAPPPTGSFWEQWLSAIGDIAVTHVWIVGAVLGLALLFAATRRIKSNRVRKAEAGLPLSREIA